MRIRQRRIRILVTLFLLVAIGGALPSTVTGAERLGLLRITKAQYPVQVPVAYDFSVKLTVEYGWHEYTDIQAALYEGPIGTLSNLLWESEAERVLELGQKTYEAHVKSPSTEGPWLLTAYAFFRNDSQSYYFTDQDGGFGFTEISIKVADNAKLTILTPHGNIPVQVDGSSYSTDASGVLVRDVKVLAEHSVGVPGNVQIAEGSRAIFQSWNETDQTNPKTILVATDLALTAEYLDEYLLDVVSSVPGVTGAGWYPAGTVANISAPQVVTGNNPQVVFGMQWKFAGWSGDLQSTSPNESIVMDNPHRVVANWTQETTYGLTIYLVLAAAAVAIGVILVVLVRRRKPKQAPPGAPSEAPSEAAPEAASEAPAEPAYEAIPESAESPATKFCIFCGADLDPGAQFCSKCGRSQVSSE